MSLEAIAAPRLQRPGHKPGDAHEYDLTCKVCGQPGTIRLTIDPQHDREAHLEYEALDSALRDSTARVEALTEALAYLLDDTQHNDHECQDLDCPVVIARALLAVLLGDADARDDADIGQRLRRAQAARAILVDAAEPVE